MYELCLYGSLDDSLVHRSLFWPREWNAGGSQVETETAREKGLPEVEAWNPQAAGIPAAALTRIALD